MEKQQHILFILDRSGSMEPQRSDVIGGFNSYIQDMRAQAAVDGLDTFVSLVTFADDHSIAFASLKVGEVPALTAETYQPRGSTALLDTVYDSVTQYREKVGQGAFSPAPSSDAPAVLVVVFTDGEENASTAHSWDDVQSLIASCEALGNWTFAYVGAHASAWSQAERLAVVKGNRLDASHLTAQQSMTRISEASLKHRKMYRDHDAKSTPDAFEEESDK